MSLDDKRAQHAVSTIFNGTSVKYDPLNRPIEITDAIGSISQLEYDQVGLSGCAECTGPTVGSNRITKQIDGNGKVTYFKYDARDLLILEIRKQGDTANVIDSNDAVVKSVYDANRNRLSLTEPNGNTTSITYDALNRTSKQTNAAGEVTTNTFDAADNLILRGHPNTNVTTNSYDELNRLTMVSDRNGRIASYTYDNETNIISDTDGNGVTTRSSYDANNRVSEITDTLGLKTKYEYDAEGNLLKVTDRLGRVTTNVYDAVDQLAVATNALGHQVHYEYDQVGNVLKITDPKANPSITRFEYDNVNRIVKQTYSAPLPNTRTFTYDSVGNLKTRTDQKGQTTTYKYDDLYRLVSRDYPKGDDDNMTYDLSGRMLSAERGGWVVTLSYDGSNRVTRSTQNGRTVNYFYDTPARTRRLIYPGGRNIIEQGDFRDRKTQISDVTLRPRPISQPGAEKTTIEPLQTVQPLVQYAYDQSDRVLSRAYRNGTTAIYTYNTNDWVLSLDHKRGASRIAGFGHAYDGEGNKLYEDKLHDLNNSETYQYDNLDRLINYRVGLLGSPIPVTQTAYNLDEAGNWNSRVTDGVTETRQHNEINEVTSIDGAQLTYDPNGNLISDGKRTYEYDVENRLVRVAPKFRRIGAQSVVEYRYDALGRRVLKNYSPFGPSLATSYVYDDNRIIEEQNLTGVTQATYVYGNYVDEVLTMDRAGETYYYHQNTQWSVVAITDQLANVVERYAYDPYGHPTVTDEAGNQLRSGGAIGNPWRFAGGQLDDESGLYFYRTRYLDPDQGRFTTRDPIGIWGNFFKSIDFVDEAMEGGEDDPDNMENGYAYVGNNPLSFVDSDGAKKTKAQRRAKIAERRAKGKAWWQITGRVLVVAAKLPFAAIRITSIFRKALFTWTDPTKIWTGLLKKSKRRPFYGNYCGMEKPDFVPGSVTPIDELDTCCFTHDGCAKPSSVLISRTAGEQRCNQDLCKCARAVDCSDTYDNYWSRKARECRAARADIRLTFCLRGLEIDGLRW